MINYLVHRFLWFRERGFVQITQKTLVSLFPFFLFSGIIRVISLSVFSELGYINQLFSVSDWLPAFRITGQVLSNLSNFLGGLAGPLSTYFAGKYTAGHYGRSTGTAGVTSLLVSLTIGSQELLMSPINDGDLTRINLPASINIMLAIFVGYLVGQIFRFSRASDDQIVDKDYIYQPKTVRPIFLSLILAIGLNILFVIGEQDNVFLTIRQVTSTFTVTDNHLFSTFMMGLLNTFSAWIGNSQAFALNSIAEDSFALENLTYAVSHHTSYKDKKVSLLSVFPSLFNNGAPFMVGIPVLLNLVYLVPFLLAPMINMGIAAVALAIHLMPAAVYPVPDGTPSLLYAFIGTGGSLRALAVSLLCFAVDVAIFIPFVHLSNKVQHGLKEEGESNEVQ